MAPNRSRARRIEDQEEQDEDYNEEEEEEDNEGDDGGDDESRQPPKRVPARDPKTKKFVGKGKKPAAPEGTADDFKERFVSAVQPVGRDAKAFRQQQGKRPNRHIVEHWTDHVETFKALPLDVFNRVASFCKEVKDEHEKPSPKPRNFKDVEAILNHMPQPEENTYGLSAQRMVEIKEGMATNPKWTSVKTTEIASGNAAFMAMWKAVCARGTCPTEVISARRHLEAHCGPAWPSTFCNWFKMLVLGSPCANSKTLSGFMRLVVASRMDDHRAVPLSDHGEGRDSFFATFAEEMAANTGGKSLKEVYKAALARCGAGSRKWDGLAILGVINIDWRKGPDRGGARDLKGTVSDAYSIKTDDLRRLVNVFDKTSGPQSTLKQFQSLDSRMSALLTRDKSHKVPKDEDNMNRLRERSVLLDLFFENGDRSEPVQQKRDGRARASRQHAEEEEDWAGSGDEPFEEDEFRDMRRKLMKARTIAEMRAILQAKPDDQQDQQDQRTEAEGGTVSEVNSQDHDQGINLGDADDDVLHDNQVVDKQDSKRLGASPSQEAKRLKLTELDDEQDWAAPSIEYEGEMLSAVAQPAATGSRTQSFWRKLGYLARTHAREWAHTDFLSLDWEALEKELGTCEERQF